MVAHEKDLAEYAKQRIVRLLEHLLYRRANRPVENPRNHYYSISAPLYICTEIHQFETAIYGTVVMNVFEQIVLSVHEVPRNSALRYHTFKPELLVYDNVHILEGVRVLFLEAMLEDFLNATPDDILDLCRIAYNAPHIRDVYNEPAFTQILLRSQPWETNLSITLPTLRQP